jgi:hypothetical protein
VTQPASSDDGARRAEFDRRRTWIRAMADRRQAMREASRLGREIGAFRSEAAQLRAEIARELHDDGESLRDIGHLAGVTKAMAQNILGRKPMRRKREQ